MDNWYVMSVWTGREDSCVESVKAYNQEKTVDGTSPFVPTRETLFKKGGIVRHEISVMFPGYAFVQTSMDTYDFMDYFNGLRRAFNGFLTVLTYGDSREIALKPEERLLLRFCTVVIYLCPFLYFTSSTAILRRFLKLFG